MLGYSARMRATKGMTSDVHVWCDLTARRPLSAIQIGAFLNFIGYHVIGLPLAATLAFAVHLQVIGLWSGLMAGVFTQVR